MNNLNVLQNIARAFTGAVFVCITPGAMLAQTVDQAPSVAPMEAIFSPALVQARTIQVTEKRAYGHSDRTLVTETLHVQVVRPDKVRVEAQYTSEPQERQFYVSDGVVQYDYSSRHNSYRKGPSGSETIDSVARTVSKVDTLILHPGAAPAAGVTRTLRNEIWNGQPTHVLTDSHVIPKTNSSPSGVQSQMIWVDAATGLPCHTALTLTIENAQPRELSHAEYSDWRFDQPIPDSRFAWIVPTGAVEQVIPQLLEVGKTAPNFAAVALDGKMVHLSDFKGRVVVLDFWATWCGPCQQLMPHLEHVYQQIRTKNQPVSILALCVLDEKSAYDLWAKKNHGSKYHFPIAFDPAGRTGKSIATVTYGVAGIPTQYVIDKEGKIAAAMVVSYDDNAHRLEETLQSLGIDASNEKLVTAKSFARRAPSFW